MRKPKDKISRYEIEDYLKRKSTQLFGREIPLFKRRKLEENFKNEILGPLPFISKENLESIILKLERNKWKEADKTKKKLIIDKIGFLKRFVQL